MEASTVPGGTVAPEATVACAAIRERSPIVTGPERPGLRDADPGEAADGAVRAASIPARLTTKRARPDERARPEPQRPVQRLQPAARAQVDAVAQHDVRALGHPDGHAPPERDVALQPQPAARPQAQQREPQRAEAGGLGNDGVGAGGSGHDRIFADADAMRSRSGPLPPKRVRGARAPSKKKKEEEEALHAGQAPPGQEGQGLVRAGPGDRRRAQAAPPQEAADLQEEEAQAAARERGAPAAPGPATPPVSGPAAPVSPPPPPPLLTTIQSPIAVYSGAFGPRQAERLLWRAGFGPRPGQAAALAALGLEKAVLSLSRPSGAAPMDGPAPTDDGEPLAPYDHYDHDLLFWLDRMVRSRHQLVERLALVFHDWFATSNDAVGSSRLMLDQTNLFRAHGLGNFETMVNKITQDPAMILFLDSLEHQVGARTRTTPAS